MGTAIESFGTALRVYASTPILLAFAAGVVVIGGLFAMIAGLVPIIGNFLSTIIIGIFLAGYAGVVYAELHNGTEPSFEAFKTAISNTWQSIAGAWLLYMVLWTVFIVVFVLLVITTGAGLAATAEPGGAGNLGIGLGVIGAFAALILVSAIIGMALQFFDIAIVVGGYDAISGFRESVSLFVSAPLSVVGFSVLGWTAVTSLSLIPLVAGVALWQVDELLGIATGGLLLFGTYVAGMGFMYTYYTTYYVQRRPETIESTRLASTTGSHHGGSRTQGRGGHDARRGRGQTDEWGERRQTDEWDDHGGTDDDSSDRGGWGNDRSD